MRYTFHHLSLNHVFQAACLGHLRTPCPGPSVSLLRRGWGRKKNEGDGVGVAAVSDDDWCRNVLVVCVMGEMCWREWFGICKKTRKDGIQLLLGGLPPRHPEGFDGYQSQSHRYTVYCTPFTPRASPPEHTQAHSYQRTKFTLYRQPQQTCHVSCVHPSLTVRAAVRGRRVGREGGPVTAREPRACR